jgi:hypothetical protein
MKTRIALSSLILGTCCISAQDVKVWTRFTGSTSDDQGYAVAVDKSGNAIVAGATQGSISGGNAGRYDLFVAKYNAAGTRLWVRQRGTAEREFAFGAATDSAGNVYITGYTGSALDGQTHYGTTGDFDIFLMKFDASGNWQWTRQDGAAPDDEGRAVATDSAGNVYMTGYIRGNFHGIPRVGTADVFISKYDSAGNRLWSALFGSTDVDESFGITCDASGNVFVTGWCSGSIDGITPYLGNGDNFLAKYNSSGQQLWLKQWGTANKDTGYGLATDATGNVYVSGYTTGPLYGTSPLGNRDYFLAKYDAAGNFLWGKHDGTSGHDQGWGAATDAAGNVYVTGETGGSLNGNTFEGLLDVFLTKYSPVGTRLWTLQYGTADNDLARGVAVDTNGTVYLAGYTAANLDGQANPGPYEPFVTKLVPATTVTPQPPTAKPATGVTSNAFTANWSVANGALGYRLDVSSSAIFSDYLSGYQNLDAGNVTSRQLTGLTPQATYYYRLRAYNTNGTSGESDTVSVTLAPVNPCAALLNAGFESGFSPAGGGSIGNNWTEWEASPGVTTGYDDSAIVHGGAHSQLVRVSSTSATSGGVYQRLPVVGGNPYTVSVWIYAGDDQSACSLGVDPAGGTNAAGAGLIWSSVTTNVAWTQKSWTGTPTANVLTVFLKVASTDSNPRDGYFDDAAPSLTSGPPALSYQRSGSLLTLSWPQCPPTRLEQAADLTSPLSWTPATNPVSVSGGRKTVTITPTSNSACFRLALE